MPVKAESVCRCPQWAGFSGGNGPHCLSTAGGNRIWGALPPPPARTAFTVPKCDGNNTCCCSERALFPQGGGVGESRTIVPRLTDASWGGHKAWGGGGSAHT